MTPPPTQTTTQTRPHPRKRQQLRRPSVAVAILALVAFSGGQQQLSGRRPTGIAVVQANPTHHGTAASAALKTALKSIDYRYFVAGGTCAAFSHGITTPIDVVKTKLQANPEKYKGKGLVSATLQICRDKEEGGPTALLNGLGPTILGYGIEGAMKFGCYEVAKPILTSLLGDSRTVLAFVLASLIAGSIAAVLLVPMESLRIKQVTDPSYRDDTILTGLPRIVRDDGFVVMMSGVWAMLAKQVPYTFGKQVSFDVVAKFLYSVVAAQTTGKLAMISADRLKWIVSLLSAFCASIAACLFSQPGDMILTETYNTNNNDGGSSGGGRTSKSKSKSKSKKPSNSSSSQPGNFKTVVTGIYGRGGLPEFFRGTQARLVHVGMIITSQLMVYDLVKQFLGLPATGSH